MFRICMAVVLLASTSAFAQATSAGASDVCTTSHDYPALAVRLGHEGNVTAGFTIKSDGSTSKVHVLKSSGFDELDRAAVTVVSCRHFPVTKKKGHASAKEAKTVIAWHLHK